MDDVAEIAGRLNKAQRAEVSRLGDVWDFALPATRRLPREMVEFNKIGAQRRLVASLSPLGLAVRAHLEKNT